ncbi:SDR family oxidoreductase [Winogradskya consettensis]|uniref:NAD(P)-dependent oxidoreductase n=1 Tax=Winogradskya consettensis TaxID=113560 RepID=A0A919SIL0_9ACTN|nr:SDR family oxidoreductase [Actinoplanes consettensis]GIM72182.1 NAD(P)-dependent oxidoreductase [Actinoplanes consettensis]
MTIVVTGATGHLGRLAIESLLSRGVPAGEIVAVGRSVEKIKDLADKGVVVKKASYDEPESLSAAFAGADKLLFISASEPGRRIPQHTNVVNAAKAAGISKIVYTSAPFAATSDAILVTDHRATEEALTASGIPSVFLRNGWYVENYNLPTALDHGLVGGAGEGKINIAPRSDYAEAAAAAILADDVDQKVYELGGEGVTLAELAALVSEVSGREVTYTNLPEEKHVEFLVSVGLPQEFAVVLADVDRAASQGALNTGTADLEKLLGRPVTPIAEAVRKALA